MERKIWVGLLGSLLLNGAQGADEPVFTLGEVQVNGSPLQEVAPGSAVVDLEEMRLHDRETVGTALDLLPGVNISKVGARNEQMAYVRGFDLRQVPVFVDGIPVYVPYDGYVDLGRFNTFDLSRIEVSKGFSSLAYGPNTLGGAINLVSRRPTKAFEGEVGGGFTFTNKGEGNGYRAYANVGSNQGSWYFQASASYLDQEYFRLPDSFSRAPGEDGGDRNNSYNRDGKVNLKLGFTPNATDEYSINYINQHGVKGTPPYAGTVAGQTPRYWQWPYWDKGSLYFISSTRFDRQTLKFKVYHDTYRNSLFAFDNSNYNSMKFKSSFKSWYNDYTDGASVEDDLDLSASNVLKVAYHWKEDVHREHNAGEPVRHFKDRTQDVAFEDTQKLGEGLSLVGGVAFSRRESLEAQDYNSKTGVVSDFKPSDNSATDLQLGLFYKTSDTGKLHATMARKSRFPTIKDRYSYRMGTAIPNADLKMERANNYEVGYSDLLAGRWLGEANLFYSDIRDLIQSVRIEPTACSTPPCTQMQNVGHAEAKGVELSLSGSLGPWDLGGNYTYLDRVNLSDPTVRLTDTPRNKLFSFGTLHHGAWSTTGSVEASSYRYSSTDGSQVAHGFAVANLKTGYRFGNGTVVEAGIRNLFDRLYAYSEGFYEEGRTFFVQFNAPL